MSAGDAGRSTKRGARKRSQERAQERAATERRDALAWWMRPGVLVFLAMVALAIGGWVLVWKAAQRITVREATVGGLHLRLQEARWVLDQMDHGENFSKPSVMMPDMPEFGLQRVTLDLAFENRSAVARDYDGGEFMLVPELGEPQPPFGAQVGTARLAPGQTLNTTLHFDFDTSEPHGKLRVAWTRDDETVYFPIPEPAEHYHLRPRTADATLPPDARLLLPIGKPERGAILYVSTYGCVACHGDPAVPDSNNVGPHLAGIGTVSSGRIEGLPGPQYIYESILDPNAFIAPECKGGLPCTEPTAMPEYASLVNLQDLADLLTYLLSLE